MGYEERQDAMNDFIRERMSDSDEYGYCEDCDKRDDDDIAKAILDGEFDEEVLQRMDAIRTNVSENIKVALRDIGVLD